MPHYNCQICNKEYKSREGLWYHKKKCISEDNKILHEPINDIDDKQTIHLLIKEIHHNVD